MQIDVDKSDTHVIEDKVMQFIRTHGLGQAGMDTNNLSNDQGMDQWYPTYASLNNLRSPASAQHDWEWQGEGDQQEIEGGKD